MVQSHLFLFLLQVPLFQLFIHQIPILVTPILNTLGNITVTYTVTDGRGFANGYIIITVYNNNPTIQQRSLTKLHWTQFRDGFTIINLLQNSVDIDSDPISIVSVSPITVGNVHLNGNNLLLQALPSSTFVNNYFTVNFIITDGIANAQSSFQVFIYNSIPVAMPDSYTLNSLSSVELNVVANDFDADQPEFDNILTIKSWTYYGNCIIIYDNTTNKLAFSPTTGSSSETFEYVITDGMSVSAPAKVTISKKVGTFLPFFSSSIKPCLSIFMFFLIILLY